MLKAIRWEQVTVNAGPSGSAAQVLNTVGEAGVADSVWGCLMLAPWDVGGREPEIWQHMGWGQPAFADYPGTLPIQQYSPYCFPSQATEPRITSLIQL